MSSPMDCTAPPLSLHLTSLAQPRIFDGPSCLGLLLQCATDRLLLRKRSITCRKIQLRAFEREEGIP